MSLACKDTKGSLVIPHRVRYETSFITDETVFPIIPDYHGRCFSVGRPIAGTDGCFDDPEAVRAWLSRAAESLELVNEA